MLALTSSWVAEDRAALRYVDEALRGDREFVLDALQRNAEARSVAFIEMQLISGYFFLIMFIQFIHIFNSVVTPNITGYAISVVTPLMLQNHQWLTYSTLKVVHWVPGS